MTCEVGRDFMFRRNQDGAQFFHCSRATIVTSSALCFGIARVEYYELLSLALIYDICIYRYSKGI